MLTMSSYYKLLDPIARTRYLEKLGLLGLEEKDDPYLNTVRDKFKDDMAKWPQLEFQWSHVLLFYRASWGIHKTAVAAMEKHGWL